MKFNYRVSRQQGLALLLLLLLLLSGSLAHVLGTQALFSVDGITEQSERARRLYQAKNALIAYSVSYADNYLPGGAGPGHLPCPDRSPIDDGKDSNDGPDPPCSRASTLIGRVPRFTWSRDRGGLDSVISGKGYGTKRLVFYAHRSLRDEQMWYAVSRSHVNNPANLKVNPATEGWLEVDKRQDIVAVIIDPGPGLSVNQGARPGDRMHAYLEGDNADGDMIFTQRTEGTSSNDLLVSITRDELMAAVVQRVGVFVTRLLSQFYQMHCDRSVTDCFPPAGDANGVCSAKVSEGFLSLFPGDCNAALVSSGLLEGVDANRHWFLRNNWLEFVRYSRDPACKADIERTCRARFEIESSTINMAAETGTTPVRSLLIRVSVKPENVML